MNYHERIFGSVTQAGFGKMCFVRFLLGFLLAVGMTALANTQPPGLTFASRTIQRNVFRIGLPYTSLYLPDPLRPNESQFSKLTTRMVPSDICISPDGTILGTSFLDPFTEAEFWDPTNGKTSWIAPDCQGFLSFTPNGQWVIAAMRFGGEIRGYEAKTGKEAFRFASGSSRLMGMKVTSDGKGLVTSGYDGQLVLWNLETKQAQKVIRGPFAKPAAGDFPIRAYTMDLSPDDKTLAIDYQVPQADRKGEGKANVKLIDVASGKTVAQFVKQADDVHSLAYSPDGNAVAVYYTTVSKDGLPDRWIVQTIDSRTGVVLQEFSNEQSGSLVFSPDGHILYGIRGPYVFGWDVRTGLVRRRLIDSSGFAKKIVMARDGSAVGTLSRDRGSALVWNGQTGTGKEVNWLTNDLEKIMFDMGSSLDENGLNRIIQSRNMEKLDMAAYDLARAPKQARQELERRIRTPDGIKNDLFGCLAVEVLEALEDRELLAEAAKVTNQETAKEALLALKRLDSKKAKK